MRTPDTRHLDKFTTAAALAFLFVAPAAAQRPGNTPTDNVIRAYPLTIAISECGRFARGDSWHLSVNSAGEAQLTTGTTPGKPSAFQIPPAEIDLLRELLIQERFFDLQADYGDIVPDGSTQTITIVVGEHTHTVRLHFLMNWVHQDPTRLVEPARAVRVGMLIRGWFQNDGAVDTRKYDQVVLDAAQKSAPK